MHRSLATLALAVAGCATMPPAPVPQNLTIMTDGSMRLAQRKVGCHDLRRLPPGTSLLVEMAPGTTYAQFSEVLTCVQSLNLPILLLGEDAEQP